MEREAPAGRGRAGELAVKRPDRHWERRDRREDRCVRHPPAQDRARREQEREHSRRDQGGSDEAGEEGQADQERGREQRPHLPLLEMQGQ